jgi:hypothetical protein
MPNAEPPIPSKSGRSSHRNRSSPGKVIVKGPEMGDLNPGNRRSPFAALANDRSIWVQWLHSVSSVRGARLPPWKSIVEAPQCYHLCILGVPCIQAIQSVQRVRSRRQTCLLLIRRFRVRAPEAHLTCEDNIVSGSQSIVPCYIHSDVMRSYAWRRWTGSR